MNGFAKKLRGLRQQKQLSQEALARDLNLSRSAIAKWENGLGMPDFDSRRIISEYFGVSEEELFADEQEPVEFSYRISKGEASKLRIVANWWLLLLGVILVCGFALSIIGLVNAIRSQSPAFIGVGIGVALVLYIGSIALMIHTYLHNRIQVYGLIEIKLTSNTVSICGTDMNHAHNEVSLTYPLTYYRNKEKCFLIGKGAGTCIEIEKKRLSSNTIESIQKLLEE